MIHVFNTDTVIIDQHLKDTYNPVSVLMTVDLLISIRERITNQIPGFDHQVSIVDDIDAILKQIPVGIRPDVDRLLGRQFAEQWHTRI